MHNPHIYKCSGSVRHTVCLSGLSAAVLTACMLLSSCSIWNSIVSPPVYDPYVTLPADDDPLPSRDDSPYTRGAAITDTKVGLNMLTEWSRSVIDGEERISVVISIICEEVTIPNPNGVGTVIIGDETYTYSPELDISDTGDPQYVHIILAKLSYPVPFGETVHVTVSWPWEKEYNGKEIGLLKTEFDAESPMYQE